MKNMRAFASRHFGSDTLLIIIQADEIFIANACHSGAPLLS